MAIGVESAGVVDGIHAVAIQTAMRHPPTVAMSATNAMTSALALAPQRHPAIGSLLMSYKPCRMTRAPGRIHLGRELRVIHGDTGIGRPSTFSSRQAANRGMGNIHRRWCSHLARLSPSMDDWPISAIAVGLRRPECRRWRLGDVDVPLALVFCSPSTFWPDGSPVVVCRVCGRAGYMAHGRLCSIVCE